jgi:hypothetical protein
MTIREQLKKKMQLVDYAQRIGMEVIRDDGRWLIVGFPDENKITLRLMEREIHDAVSEEH